ncbi:DUF420 domain-containing protein [Limnochorda pilosa]|uniref:DUF420 domain-containing protein n=1 Tax=Limnochorda pilosa TaxID=1555112 RepID=A0A0K2SJG2_LIMPI|nr:DUF420 domain-containing protein [Limnochorda pilosa]BAS27248.1 hypothetical protein LIP_1397 [Limnochorda pilosa]
METAFVMASINALINATSAVVIVRARRFIRNKNVPAHRRLMIIATVLQGVFLALYLIKAYLFGTTLFEGSAAVRVLYLALLAVHVGAATVSAPLVVYALVLGLQRRFGRHRAVVRWAYPLWLFVSVSGPLTYLMLYGLGRPGYGLQAMLVP